MGGCRICKQKFSFNRTAAEALCASHLQANGPDTFPASCTVPSIQSTVRTWGPSLVTDTSL